jgi:hypothetical protein
MFEWIGEERKAISQNEKADEEEHQKSTIICVFK